MTTKQPLLINPASPCHSILAPMLPTTYALGRPFRILFNHNYKCSLAPAYPPSSTRPVIVVRSSSVHNLCADITSASLFLSPYCTPMLAAVPLPHSFPHLSSFSPQKKCLNRIRLLILSLMTIHRRIRMPHPY